MRKIISLFVMLLLSWHASAQDQSRTKTDRVGYILSSELSTAPAGETVWFALTAEVPAGVATFWNNSATDYEPSKLSWIVPEGISVGKPLYAVPKSIMVEGKPAYGYAYSDTSSYDLLIPVTIAEDYTESSAKLTLNIESMACTSDCRVEIAAMSLTINIGDMVYSDTTEDIFIQARSKLPGTSFWSSEMQSDNDEMLLLVHLAPDEMADIEAVSFFPYADGVLLYGAEQSFTIAPEGLYLRSKREATDPMASSLDGVLSIRYKNGETVNVVQESKPSASLKKTSQAVLFDMSIFELILYALLGGIILNLMPCVFPVLSLKALALLRSHQSHRGEGWAYTAGILTSFILIALTILAIRNGGETIGWGFQLQEPIFVAAMVFVLAAVGLSLSGLYTIQIGIEGAGNSLTESQGAKGSFFTGVLAALVATPCTAPFMAPAIGYAITQPMHITLVGFTALGFGLALPFLLLSYFPILSNILPKPGAWMEKVKEALAFPMYLTAAWLIWVFTNQTNSNASLMLMLGLILFAFSIWLWQQSKSKVVHMFSVAVLVGSIFIAIPTQGNPASHDILDGEPFSTMRLEELKKEGRRVFVYFSADWCITCKVNENISLYKDENRKLVVERNIAILKGDWTNRNETIAKVLASHNRMGVPLYLYYASGEDQPHILPEILTPDSLTDIFREK